MAQSDIFEVAFIVDVAGQPTATICHAQQTTSSPTENEEEDLKLAIENSNILNAWYDRSSTQATLDSVKISLISPTTRPGSYFSYAQDGAVGTRTCAAQTSVNHYWAAEPFERKNIGRKFWSGVPSENVSRGRLLTGQVTLEQALADAFEDPISGTGTYQFGVWSEKFETFEALGVVRPKIVLSAIRNRRGRPVV